MKLPDNEHNPGALSVLRGEQFAEWDRFTIENENISSIQLMEQACIAFVAAFHKEIPNINQPITIVAGNGNNGGDALGIARLLIGMDYASVELICADPERHPVSSDYKINFIKLPRVASLKVIYWEDFQSSSQVDDSILIDGLLGTGLQLPLREEMSQRINTLLQFRWKKVFAIDIPSGLNADNLHESGKVLSADITYTFGRLKRSFLWPENAPYIGSVEILHIGLSNRYRPKSNEYFTDDFFIGGLLKKEKPFAHKYNFGKAHLIAGSKKYPGAAVLASKGCFSSGAGLVEVSCTNEIITNWLSHLPEVIPQPISQHVNFSKVNAILFGSGIDPTEWNSEQLQNYVNSGQEIPWVIDGNAFQLFDQLDVPLPTCKVWTPHEGEFDQIAGASLHSIQRLEKAKSFASQHDTLIVLKGRYSKIIFPNGTVFFNTTGNVALAKAGTGDLLAGIITGLIAQGYSCQHAALIGVYVHGLSADLLCKSMYNRSIMATEIAEGLSNAFLQLAPYKTT